MVTIRAVTRTGPLCVSIAARLVWLLTRWSNWTLVGVPVHDQTQRSGLLRENWGSLDTDNCSLDTDNDDSLDTDNDDSLDTDKTMKWIVWDRNENATAQEQTITRLYLA